MSERPHREVADVFRIAGITDSLRAMTRHHHRVVRDLVSCRTAALGGHIDECDRCGHRAISYNSCRNRHCPKCQGSATAAWLDEQTSKLLPVPYAHVVFTLPHTLAPLALQNPRVLYGILFRAASETLLEIAADPRHLGARIGFLAILHTWGQTLHHHPHLHCVVPAGGLSPDGERWIPCKRGFFLPVRVLSRLFRRKWIELARSAFAEGRLHFHGKLAELNDVAHFRSALGVAREREWVVYAKPPFGGPEHVLKYLARYTHRVAISNRRLLQIDSDTVTFTWKDYAHADRTRTMTLDTREFARRFLLHVLPSRFVRIRYYGLLAHANQKRCLARCRQLLDSTPESTVPPSPAADLTDAPASTTLLHCPHCRTGTLRRLSIPPYDSS